jgi:hypothetical protein
MTAQHPVARKLRTHRSYDLRSSQTPTPSHVVELFWKIVRTHRPDLGRVLDMGAGDGRFAHPTGHFKRYLGVEIDPNKLPARQPGPRARVRQGCVFKLDEGEFDACIGNPPYLRHHNIEQPWKLRTASRLGRLLKTKFDARANLFVYFLALGLLKTASNGLVALIVPFDWVSRPATARIREYITTNNWAVHVYRFTSPIFDGVSTTASITIIDKCHSSGRWTYHNIASNFSITARLRETGTDRTVLPYSRDPQSDTPRARRGISPGGQRTFALTDGERAHHGLLRRDLLPCVTTLRGIDIPSGILDRATFESNFVRAGRRCWLIRSRGEISQRLKAYLEALPAEARANATCARQTPWYHYEAPRVPDLLVHSAFVANGPRVLINALGAIAVGTVYGVFGCEASARTQLARQIRRAQVADAVVPHSRRLRKLEVGQLNAVLEQLTRNGQLLP